MYTTLYKLFSETTSNAPQTALGAKRPAGVKRVGAKWLGGGGGDWGEKSGRKLGPKMTWGETKLLLIHYSSLSHWAPHQTEHHIKYEGEKEHFSSEGQSLHVGKRLYNDGGAERYLASLQHVKGDKLKPSIKGNVLIWWILDTFSLLRC